MILMLSENLKYVLNQSTDTLVDLEKDLTFIDNYLEFQKLRTQGINNISYKKEIDSYNHSIAPLILIDLIENAFKYAVYKDSELSNIDIYLSVQNGKLHFYCENEFDDNLEKNKTTQIGLKNLQQRLLLIYKDNYTLNINKKNGMFKVDLKINLE
jgi:LytS/YehU family sensor histidine kinase